MTGRALGRSVRRRLGASRGWRLAAGPGSAARPAAVSGGAEPRRASASRPGGPGRAPAGRPAQQQPRGAGRPPRAPRPAAPRPRGRSSALTRLAILACIGVVLAVTLFPTVRSYLRQRGEIAALRQDVASQTATVEDLIEQRRRWNDPAFVEQQARERLKLVRPGETSYSVLDAPGAPSASTVPATPEQVAAWYERVWTSMTEEPGTGAEPGAPGAGR